MDSRKEEQHGGAVGWMTVPTFGDWDMKNGPVPDYSMDFSKIREMRKQNKRELSRASLGGDDDLLAQQHKTAQAQGAKAAEFAPAADDHHRPLHTAHDDSPTRLPPDEEAASLSEPTLDHPNQDKAVRQHPWGYALGMPSHP